MNEKLISQKTHTILLDDLKMAGYQRPTNSRQVKSIANNFDEAKLGFLVVSFRDGQYFLLDGAHRAAALRRLGYAITECIVLEDMTYEQEAEYFRNQNTNRHPLSLYDLYKAGIEANDELYVKINAVVVANDFRVSTNNRDFNAIKAINALKTVAEIYGYENLDATLRTIRKTWDGILLATNREFIVGVAEFICRYGENGFAERLRDKPVGAIWHDYLTIIGRYAGSPSHSYDIRKIFCSVLVEHYNRGLSARSKKRLSWEG